MKYTHTSTWFGSFLPNPGTIILHQQGLLNGDRYPRAARKWWRGEGGAGDLMRGTRFS
jgi:hypothetical protein